MKQIFQMVQCPLKLKVFNFFLTCYHYFRMHKLALVNCRNFEIKLGKNYFPEFMMANDIHEKMLKLLTP